MEENKINVQDSYGNSLKEGFYLYCETSLLEPLAEDLIFLTFDEKGNISIEYPSVHPSVRKRTLESKELELLKKGRSSLIPYPLDSIKSRVNGLMGRIKWYGNKLEELAKHSNLGIESEEILKQILESQS